MFHKTLVFICIFMLIFTAQQSSAVSDGDYIVLWLDPYGQYTRDIILSDYGTVNSRFSGDQIDEFGYEIINYISGSYYEPIGIYHYKLTNEVLFQKSTGFQNIDRYTYELSPYFLNFSSSVPGNVSLRNDWKNYNEIINFNPNKKENQDVFLYKEQISFSYYTSQNGNNITISRFTMLNNTYLIQYRYEYLGEAIFHLKGHEYKVNVFRIIELLHTQRGYEHEETFYDPVRYYFYDALHTERGTEYTDEGQLSYELEWNTTTLVTNQTEFVPWSNVYQDSIVQGKIKYSPDLNFVVEDYRSSSTSLEYVYYTLNYRLADIGGIPTTQGGDEDSFQIGYEFGYIGLGVIMMLVVARRYILNRNG